MASCYRALLCCCSCSWCSKLDDGENGAVNDEYQIDHVDPGTRAPVTVAETINDIEDQLEGSAGKRTMIVSPSPPSQSPRASDLLGPPSTPVADFFTQISTPRRPSRPGRKSCVGKHKESKTDKEPKTTHLSRRSYKSDRRKKVKSSSCKVEYETHVERCLGVYCPQVAYDLAAIFPYGSTRGRTRPYLTGLHFRVLCIPV